VRGTDDLDVEVVDEDLDEDLDEDVEDDEAAFAGEHVVLDLHPHWRRLVVPFVAVPVVAAAATFALLAGADAPAYRAAVVVLALVVAVFVSGIPYLRWRTTRYFVTDRRVVGRAGILTHYASDVPLYRVADVHSEATLGKRMLRTGDLVLEGLGDAGTLRLVEVPRVEQVQRTVLRLMDADDRRRRGLPTD
jgi:uncharacterized membrane protein YdbT with pleckstrin-like domain